MAKRNVWIVPHNDAWAVRREESERVTSTHARQSDAIEHGREIAQRERVELVIQGRDGRIRDRDSYGNDPCPPKDEKH